jgi:hypothetical protein
VLRKIWASFQKGATTTAASTELPNVVTDGTRPPTKRGTETVTTVVVTPSSSTATATTISVASHSDIFVLRHKGLIPLLFNASSEPEKENIEFTGTTTTTTNIPFLNVSFQLKTEDIEFTATTTTTTTANRESDYVVEKTLLVDESKVASTKIYVIVFAVIFTAVGCVVVVVAYIRYMKRKRNVVLPTIVYHRNQPVVIPDVSETPVNTHRTRIAELSQNFLPLTVSISSSRFGQQQQQQQQFQEIKVEDIKFFVPDFSPFPGFDIAEFRQILANVQNRARPLITSSTSDPVAVFQSFPEIDCLN